MRTESNTLDALMARLADGDRAVFARSIQSTIETLAFSGQSRGNHA